MQFNKDELIKSPLNYTGGKFKLLPQILPLFPDDIDAFYDLFCGGCNVGINVKANKIVCNDIYEPLMNLLKMMYNTSYDKIKIEIEDIIDYYKLGKNTKAEYLQLRNDYNTQSKYNKNILLYTLSCFSFNYQIRFNAKGKFNMPCGNRGFSKNMDERFKAFQRIFCHNKHIVLHNKNYNEIFPSSINDFVYLDPPYLQTVAPYNENGGWNTDKELALYKYIEDLHCHRIRFALSNTMYYHNKENILLKQWCNQHDFKINILDHNYTNNNRYNKNNQELTQEVLITNY